MKAFYRQINLESSCVKKETVDIDILITSRNGDWKILQSIRITRWAPSRIRKWNQLLKFTFQRYLRLPGTRGQRSWGNTFSDLGCPYTHSVHQGINPPPLPFLSCQAPPLKGERNKFAKWWLFTLFGCRELVFQKLFQF